ncbi:MAG: glycoside hydrolase family 32 protein, partial [Phycisphaeraceae bacterium]|nr:glycoside hydrolase family 32 protein [Phycisphaeraceae bacterium]
MKMNLLTCFLLAVILLSASTVRGQYDPHPKGIDYSENFRGQFHFSPKSEWMNDINALMYLDG